MLKQLQYTRSNGNQTYIHFPLGILAILRFALNQLSMDRSGLVDLPQDFKKFPGSASTVRRPIVLYGSLLLRIQLQCEELFRMTIQKICPSIADVLFSPQTCRYHRPSTNTIFYSVLSSLRPRTYRQKDSEVILSRRIRSIRQSRKDGVGKVEKE